jgi:hypothetical protein
MPGSHFMALAIRMGIYGSGHIMAKHSVGVLD